MQPGEALHPGDPIVAMVDITGYYDKSCGDKTTIVVPKGKQGIISNFSDDKLTEVRVDFGLLWDVWVPQDKLAKPVCG